MKSDFCHYDNSVIITMFVFVTHLFCSVVFLPIWSRLRVPHMPVGLDNIHEAANNITAAMERKDKRDGLKFLGVSVHSFRQSAQPCLSTWAILDNSQVKSRIIRLYFAHTGRRCLSKLWTKCLTKLPNIKFIIIHLLSISSRKVDT